jgi:peroxiredoxin
MKSTTRWPGHALKLAAVYNLLWGAWVILFPNHLFEWSGIALPNYPGIWQCVGMIVGVYGIGYWIAASDFVRHWPIVLVGLLGKIFGPIGFLQSALVGQLPWAWGWTIVTNDLIWWVPFAGILYLAFKHHNDPIARLSGKADAPLPTAAASSGLPLEQLLVEGNQLKLLVFLRHSGCTFCRETLSELSRLMPELAQQSIEPIVVHMGDLEEGRSMLHRHRLDQTVHISDPACTLYRKYGLSRGTFLQLFGPAVWWQGFKAGILRGHGLGKLSGDGFQLGGSVLLRNGKPVKIFPAPSATTHLPSTDQCRVA